MSKIPRICQRVSFSDSGSDRPPKISSRFFYLLLNRDWAQGANDATQSRPVDLEQVTARLLQASADKASPQPPSPRFQRESSEVTLTPPSAEECEREFYNQLVNGGGRPLYPIHLLQRVSKDPGAHQDMLRPWLETPNEDPPEWRVFKRQALDWEGFRRWQMQNRYADKDTTLSTIPDPEYNFFFRHLKRKSPNYTEALGDLIAQYDFTRPFQLHQDPTQQDKLTTWIEYLGYACAVHSRFIHLIKKRQPDYDRAWKTLVDSGVLRPSETDEYIRGIECLLKRQSESDQAEKAVRMAELAVASKVSQHAHQTSVQISATAQSRLDAARRSLESIQKRDGLVRAFKAAILDYGKAEKGAKRHSPVVQWIMEQVPVIESELKTPMTAEGGQSHKVMNDRASRKQRGDDQPNSQVGGSATSKRSHHNDTADDVRPSKRLRATRSGGITKAAPLDQPTTRRDTRSQRSARAPRMGSSSGPVPKVFKRASNMLDKLGGGTRRSRRLAGDLPEFGLLQEPRGALPVFEPDVPRPSRAAPRSQDPAKGAKPRESERTKHRMVGRSKRLKR